MAAAYTADNLCTKHGNVSLKSAAYKWERLQIKSGLWWRAYGIWCMNTTSSLLSFWILLLLHNQPIYVYGGSTCSLHVSWEPHFASHFSAKWKEEKYCFSLRMQLYDACQYQLYIINCNLFGIFWIFFVILVLLQLLLANISNSWPFYR